VSRGRFYEHLVHAAFRTIAASRMLETRLGHRCFIGGYFRYKRWLEDPYARLVRLRPELFQGGDILDVGANIGYTAVLFAGALAGNHKVYAFEPEPFNLELLAETIQRRGLGDRIVPVAAAVGVEEGSVELWINPAHPADHRVRTVEFSAEVRGQKTVTVPMLSLDRFVRERGIAQVSFIKIDVQGFEPAVCAGMERILAENPAAAVGIEYMPEAIRALGFDPAELPRWFRQRGYRASSIDSGEPVPDVPELAEGGYLDLLWERAAIQPGAL
jgi:FkbM family methyltransferase